MVDAADLLNIQPNENTGALSRAPESHLSSGQIAQPFEDMARALNKVGSNLEAGSAALEQGAVTAAERQAYADLGKQRVTRDQNGNVQVLDPANSVFWGAAGRHYENIVRQGTAVQAAGMLNQGMVEDASRNMLNPAGFKAASDARLDTFQKQFGNTPWGSEALMRGRERQTEHSDYITNRSAEADIAEKAKAVNQQIDDIQGTMSALARQNGVDSPEFAKAQGQYKALLQSKVDNPNYKYSADERDEDLKRTVSRMRAEATIASIDQTMNRGDRAAAQKALTDSTLNNPNLQPKDQQELYRFGMAHLEFLSANQRADFKVAAALVADVQKSLASGTDANDPGIQAAVKKIKATGDAEAVNDINGTLKYWGPLNSLKRTGAVTPGAPSNPGGSGAPPRPGHDAMALNTATGETYSAGGLPVEKTSLESGVSAGRTGFMDALAQIESGNANIFSRTDPDVAGPGSRSQGYFQINVPTWDDFAGRAGVDVRKYPTPMNAPKEIQAQVAAVIPLSRFGPRTRTMLAQQFGIDENSHATIGELAQGRGGTSVSPGGSGGPQYSKEDFNDPYFLHQYLRAEIHDPEDKASFLKESVSSMEQTVKFGNVPDPQMMGQVEQAIEKEPDKYGYLGAQLKGIEAAAVAIGGGGGAPMTVPQAEAYRNQIASVVNGKDAYTQHALSTATGILDAMGEQAKKAPLSYMANEYRQPQPPPLDPDHPETLGAVLTARGTLAQHLGALAGTSPPPILQEGDGKILNGILQGPQGAAALVTLAQTARDQDLHTLTDDKSFVNSINAMRTSGDYPKAAAAFALMSRMEGDPEFDIKFQNGLKDLAWWDARGSSLSPEDFKKEQAARHDPEFEEKMRPFEKAAENYITTNKVDPNFVLSRLPHTMLGGVGAPAPAGLDNGANADMLYDWKNALYAGARSGLDMNSAATLADKTIQNKWTRSDVNDGRWTAYAPEQMVRNPDGSPATVNGSMSWMKDSLDKDLKQILNLPSGLSRGQTDIAHLFGPGPPEKMRDGQRVDLTREEQANVQEFNGPRILQGDAQTRADIASRKPPSYGVWLQDQSGAWFAPVDSQGRPARVRFDSAEAKSLAISAARPPMNPPGQTDLTGP